VVCSFEGTVPRARFRINVMSGHPAVIVVADDNTAINSLLSDLLTDEGYRVISCFTGAEAFRVIQHISPDVVLLNMHMETSEAGLTVLKNMRATHETAHISAIIFSADDFYLEAAHQEIAAHHAEIMREPFDFDQLLAKIKSYCALL
jgi:CheY-like chemotaxis protein